MARTQVNPLSISVLHQSGSATRVQNGTKLPQQIPCPLTESGHLGHLLAERFFGDLLLRVDMSSWAAAGALTAPLVMI